LLLLLVVRVFAAVPQNVEPVFPVALLL